MPTLADFFCGCGGMGLGFKQAGFSIVGAWDVDKYAVASYQANVGDYVQQKDISQMKWDDVPRADVWSMGFPCQDLSVAGRQAGLFDGKRSNLFFEVMRLLTETAENDPSRLPTFIMAENVKGLKPYLDVLQEQYDKHGYKMEFNIYNSKYWGVPQSRERYFIVGTRKDSGVSFVFPQEQHDYVPQLVDFLDEDVPEKFYIADEKGQKIIEQAMQRLSQLGNVHAVLTPDHLNKKQNGRRAKEDGEVMFTLTARELHGIIHKTIVQPEIHVLGMLDIKSHDHSRRVHDPEGISPTCTAVAGGTHHIKILDGYRVRRLTPNEYGKLQGFPMDSWQWVVSNTQVYKQFGNAVTVPVVKALALAIKEALAQRGI